MWVQNLVEWKHKVAANGNTQVKYKYLQTGLAQYLSKPT